MCWGHAEDCYLKDFYDDLGFVPTFENYKELHYAWLSSPKNNQMFSRKFVEWINTDLLQPKVEVRSENTLEGKGVFATTAFKEGDFIGFFDGQLSQDPSRMSLQFGVDLHVEPSNRTPFRYLNHSCDANSYFVGHNLYAWQSISPGHEITIDYNCNELELISAFRCRCGITGCVGEIKGYNYLTNEQKNHRRGKLSSWVTTPSK